VVVIGSGEIPGTSAIYQTVGMDFFEQFIFICK